MPAKRRGSMAPFLLSRALGAIGRRARGSRKRPSGISRAISEEMAARAERVAMRREYEELLKNREARTFFSKLGQIIPATCGMGFFRELKQDSGRRIAVMLWESGFSVQEAKNLFLAVKEMHARRKITPQNLEDVLREFRDKRLKEYNEAGEIQSKCATTGMALAHLQELLQ